MVRPSSHPKRKPPKRATRRESATDFERRLWRAGRAVAIARSRAMRYRAMVFDANDVTDR